ncbi:Uncharacterised protein [Mycobacterium tuberculosis]|nr:Uncharacterised protein [Mycobacterium tuberculosis]
MRNIGIKVSFETLKSLPVLPTEELILKVPENLLSSTVIDTVAFT